MVRESAFQVYQYFVTKCRQARHHISRNSGLFSLFTCQEVVFHIHSGLPQSGKNIWKMKFFPGQGKVREFCGWSGKFRKDLESQGI